MRKQILKGVLGILMIFTLVGFASATTDVTWTVFNATINSTGDVVTTTDPVTSFNVVGYFCADVACTTIGSQFLAPTAVSGNSVMVTFPTNPPQFGYNLYFYENDYIAWEIPGIFISGTNPPVTASPVYLSKKESGYAPILNLSVLNQVEPNKLIEINVTAGIDAQTVAAIQNAGLSGAVPELTSLENVNTTVTLEIRDSSNAMVYNETQEFLIPFSATQDISFTYNFTQEGAYTIDVLTSVANEPKILSSVQQSTSAATNVVQQNLTNYTYSIVNNLAMNNTFPAINETVLFSFNYLSNYVNETNSSDLTPVSTIISATIYRNGTIINTSTYNLAANPDPVNFVPFNFTNSFTQAGSYLLVVTGTPNSTLGNQTLNSTQNLVFSIGGAADSGGTSTSTGGTSGGGGSTISDDDDTGELKLFIDNKNKVSSDNGTLDLTLEEEKKVPAYKVWVWTLAWLIFILLIVILIVAALKARE